MSEESSSKSGGVGFFGLLFIALLVLKLTNVIQWSWWTITAPLWGPLAVIVVAAIVILIFQLIRAVLK